MLQMVTSWEERENNKEAMQARIEERKRNE
jgi:hypothetical protein